MMIDEELCQGCSHNRICKFQQEIWNANSNWNHNPGFDGPEMKIVSCPQYCGDNSNVHFEELPDIPIEEKMEILKELTKVPEEKGPEIIAPSEEKCAECGTDNVQLLTCSVCGKHICADCATEDFSGKIYCEKCNDERAPDII